MKYISSIILVLFSLQGKAQQDTVSAEEALLSAVERNYNIMLTEYDLGLAANDLDYAIYSFFPSLNASLNQNASVGNFQQTLADTVINNRNAFNSNLGASLDADWLVFDGLARIATVDLLNATQERTRVMAMQVVQNVTADILTNYYDIVFQQKQLQVLQQNLEFSLRRLDLARTQYEVGSMSRQEYLAAQVDYNADKSQLLNARVIYEQNLINFNFLAFGVATETYVPGDSLGLVDMLSLEALEQMATRQNPMVRQAMVEVEAQRLQKKIIRADFLPDVTVRGSYEFSRNQSAGFLRATQRSGVGYGLTVSVPIFNQMSTQRRITNAEIIAEQLQVQKKLTEESLISDIRQTYTSYVIFLELMQLESDNIVIAQENAAIALESYELGTISALELREAQLQLLQAENRRLEAIIQAKRAEIELTRLSGTVADTFN